MGHPKKIANLSFWNMYDIGDFSSAVKIIMVEKVCFVVNTLDYVWLCWLGNDFIF